MKFYHPLALAAALFTLASCDDDTKTLGVDMMPTTDLVSQSYTTYGVTTESYAVGDSVLARSSKSYLGRFTDPETGTTVKSDFLAQFHCDEGYALPDSIEGDSCTSLELRLYIEDFVGDSLASFKLSVYELDQQLDPNADYYTNIDPEKYCNTSAKPIATKWFTISDQHRFGTMVQELQQQHQGESSSRTWYTNHPRLQEEPRAFCQHFHLAEEWQPLQQGHLLQAGKWRWCQGLYRHCPDECAVQILRHGISEGHDGCQLFCCN